MRLTADEPARIKGYGFLFVVRKDSPFADIAMDFIARQTYKTGEERRNSRLYRDIPESKFTPTEGVDGYVLTVNGRMPTGPNGCIFAPIPSIQPTLIRSRRSCAHSSHWGK